MLSISATDELLATYNDMKIKHKIGYIIASIQKNAAKKEVIAAVEDGVYIKQEDEDYREAFMAKLKESGTVRYGVVDYNNKLLFVHWSPDSAKGKDKMMYASVKEALIDSFVGINKKLQASDDGELTADVIAELTKSKV